MKKVYILTLALWSGMMLPALGQHVSAGYDGTPEKITSKGDIPRLAWYSVPAGETTLQRYRELKDAGITVNFSFFLL